jgi:hypothetical protein
MQALGSPEEDRQGRFDHGGWQMPSFDDAGRALEWSKPTLIDGEVPMRGRAPRTRETKRLRWTQ